jgi:hypothetical protein
MIDRQSACRFWPAGARQRAAWLFKDLFSVGGPTRLAVAAPDIVISSIFHSVASRSSAHEIISHDLVGRLALKTAAREKMAW